VVVPHRRLSQLRERIDLRVRCLWAWSTRPTSGRKCPDLLFPAAGWHRDRHL